VGGAGDVRGRGRPQLFSTIVLLHCPGLPEAAVPLSAARLSRMAAAVVEIFKLQPVIAKQELYLGGPRKGRLKISEKSRQTRTSPFHYIPQGIAGQSGWPVNFWLFPGMSGGQKLFPKARGEGREHPPRFSPFKKP